MSSRTNKLRVFAPPVAYVRPPKAIRELTDSFMIGSAPEEIDFTGYVPRGEKRYHLSEAEMYAIVDGIARGLTKQAICQLVFSPSSENLLRFSQIPFSKVKSCYLYMAYLRYRGVKVSAVRNGEMGLLRHEFAKDLATIRTFAMKRMAATEEGSTSGKRRKKSGAKAQAS